MKNTKWAFCLFLAMQSLFLFSDRNPGPTRSSAATEAKLDTVNANLSTLISSISAVASNTATTAANTATSSSANATTVTLKNQGGANHDDSGISNWDYPLNITSSTTGNTFKFSQNILFKPINANLTAENAAIIIAKDNVTIDLCGQTLYFDSSDLTSGLPAISGIHIKAGVKGTQIISSTNNTNYKGAIKDFTEYGVYFKGTSGSIIKQGNIDNIICAQNSRGIQAEYTNLLSITNCQCIGNTHATGNVYGICLQNINNVTIDEVTSNENYSIVTTYGMYLENARSCTIKNSAANLNYSTSSGASGSAYGIYITSTGAGSSFSNNISSCTANENYCTANTSIATQEAVGIMITTNSATTESNTIAHCETKRNLYATGTGVAPDGFGIKLNGSGKNQIEACTASHNSTTGIVDALAASTSFFTKNLSFFNGSSNYSVTFNKETGSTGPATKPMATIKIHISDHLGLKTAMQGLSNVEIVA